MVNYIMGFLNIYINRLIEWINPSYENTITSQLLLRKSRDGDNYLTFHKLCDKKDQLLF